MRHVALCLLAGLAAGCASARPDVAAIPSPASYVEQDVTRTEARILAGAMASVVARRAQGPVSIVAASANDPVAPALADALRAAGTSVAQGGIPAVHRLSYRIGEGDDGLMLRMQFDRDLAAQPFDRRRDGLQPLGPIAVVEIAG